MRKSKFSDEEIKVALEKLDKGATVEELAKKLDITPATVYNWKKKFSVVNEATAVSPGSVSKFNNLQEENYRLKLLVATLSLEKQALEEQLNRKRTFA